MQDKMERVLTLLYSAYVNSGGTIGAPQKQALIENGLGGMLAIEDGGTPNSGAGPPSVQALLGFNADDPDSPVVYNGEQASGFSDPAGIDFANDIGISYLKSPSLDQSLVRLNSLRSDDIDMTFDMSSSNSRPPTHSSNGKNSQNAYKVKEVDEIRRKNDNVNFSAASSSSSAAQPTGIAMVADFDPYVKNSSNVDSHDFQGKELTRIPSINDVLKNDNPSKRPKVEELSPLEQQEYDLLKRNQNTTLEKIDSLDATISNLLDFIDEGLEGHDMDEK